MREASILTVASVPARLGARLIALLAIATVASFASAVWLQVGAPIWMPVIASTAALLLVVVLGYLMIRPTRVHQPPWARRYSILATTGAILVPLLALFPSVADSAVGVWVMAGVAFAEAVLLVVTVCLVATHREPSNS